jgi:hypothetical protein
MWDSSQVYDDLDVCGPESNLVVISGHGLFDRVSIACDRSRYGKKQTPADLTLAKGDRLLINSLAKLKPETVLFLDACNTAQEKVDDDNLAMYIGVNNPHLVLIAAREPYSASSVVIDTVFPLRLKIFSLDCRELTFIMWGNLVSAQQRNRLLLATKVTKEPLALTGIKPEYIFGPIKDNAQKHQLEEINQQIEAAYLSKYDRLSMYDRDRVNRVADQVESIPGVSIVEKRDIVGEFFQTDWQYLFGERLKKHWCPAFSSVFGSDASAIVSDVLGFLQQKGYSPVKEPQNGDIAVYFYDRSTDAPVTHPLENAVPFYFGEYNQGAIISKPSCMHVICHPIDLYRPANHIDASSDYLVYFREQCV